MPHDQYREIGGDIVGPHFGQWSAAGTAGIHRFQISAINGRFPAARTRLPQAPKHWEIRETSSSFVFHKRYIRLKRFARNATPWGRQFAPDRSGHASMITSPSTPTIESCLTMTGLTSASTTVGPSTNANLDIVTIASARPSRSPFGMLR